MGSTKTTKASKTEKESQGSFGFDLGLGGLFQSLSGFVEKLGDLAEKGERLSRTGEFHGTTPHGKEYKGVYGFNVKVGLGGEGVSVQPFGNIQRNDDTGQVEISEVREPMVDVFEEHDHVLVVAEMPGVGRDDLQVELKDDILTLAAKRGEKRYRKEVLLPAAFSEDKMTVTCNSGIVEIKLVK